jgi:hypothetical protein
VIYELGRNLVISLASTIWDQEDILLNDSSKLPNYQGALLLFSACSIEGYIVRKMPREGHQGGLVLARQRAGSQGTCNPKKMDYLGF